MAKKYPTAIGMRKAIEDRLNRISRNDGIDINKIRRHVSFDRFLARLSIKAPNDIIIKGGYALELRLNYARTTKDIDLSIKNYKEGQIKNNENLLQEFLQDCAEVDLGDHFNFLVGRSTLDIENALYGGFRFPIEAQMAGRTFSKFRIDIAFGDIWIEPHEIISPNNWLEFAGLESPKIPIISIEQQFAEKLHSYTLPRERPNSRVKDIVDILALIRIDQIDILKLRSAITDTFKRRKTHEIPSRVPDAPENWTMPFKKLASECQIDISIGEAIEEINLFYNNVNL